MYRLSTYLLLPLLLMAAACEKDDPEIGQEDLVRSVNVHLSEVALENFSSYLRLAGRVTTVHDVRISAEVNGRVVQFFRREGDLVRQGEPILKIDDQRLQQEVRRQNSVTEQSRENYERLQRLYSEEGIGTEMDVLNARHTYEQNQASQEGLQVDLENTTIRAPFEGHVESIHVETGEMVSQGTQVVRIISRSEKKITFGVPARYADLVDSGDEAEVWFDSEPDQRHTLPIVFVGSSIDPRNRTFRVDLALPAHLETIKVDILANVRLRTDYLQDVVVISEEHLFRRNGAYVAYVAGENEQGQTVAEQRTLRLGPSFGSRIVVDEGLAPGDRLVTTGASYLQDQTRITIVEEEYQGMANQRQSR